MLAAALDRAQGISRPVTGVRDAMPGAPGTSAGELHRIAHAQASGDLDAAAPAQQGPGAQP